ncbi:FecCD family ABC transporter permease [Pokkaliibacter sp. CJK22405]|uniref:FecCD family ABC transporter permease n=1 Tax=Pokkaliibacter sp. CJK22405 TaxID=3384615 RepID=UPI00398555EE
MALIHQPVRASAVTTNALHGQVFSTAYVPKGYWCLKWGQRSVLIHQRPVVVNLCLILLLLGVMTLALGLGSMALSPVEVWRALLGEGSALQQLVVRELRLMRVLAAVATGAAFAVSGCLMQALARNRLATPGIIGIDNAATAFAVASVVNLSVSVAPPAMALAGAMTATALAFGLGGATGTRGYRFIIAGVAIGALSGAVTQLMLSEVSIDVANAAFPWTVGSLSARSPEALAVLSLGLIPGVIIACRLARALNLLQLSESVSISLGIRVPQVRFVALLLSVMLTALAVAVAGPVGLVALLGPEIARVLCRHRGIPVITSACCGALLMLAADLLGRLMLAPLEIPVGIVTAIAGSPYLLWMLLNPAYRTQP